jgi:hypothetical protein
MKIGSIFWRLRNYGIIATFKYIYTEKINKSIFDNSQSELISNLAELNNELFKINEKNILDLGSSSDKFFNEISENLINLELKGVGIKNSVIGNSGSKTRLKVLAYIINYFDFDLIIESGTQHGISALFMERFAITKNTKIYSIDIKNNVIPEGIGKINYVVLSSPVRKSFKTFTKRIIKSNGRSLYFHDSDHSYENMSFEFNWAWNELKVDCLISDDVSENTAFSKFVLKNKLTPYYCRFDSGSVVGIVLK